MIPVPINASQAHYLELYRVALSEPTQEERLRAIQTISLEVQSKLFAVHLESRPSGEPWGPGDLEMLGAIAETDKARLEAARDYVRLSQRFEGTNGLGNERKLNIAEHIGKLILLAIMEKEFTGLHTENGILAQVREQGSKFGVRGSVDKDTVREIWKSYRGVVHLGIAIDHAEDYPEQQVDVLRLAESMRLNLSQHFPQGTKNPYVNPGVQISFEATPDT